VLNLLAWNPGTTSGSQPFMLHHQGVIRDAATSESAASLKQTMGQKHWTKRSRKTGEFMDQKKVGKFKSVRRERNEDENTVGPLRGVHALQHGVSTGVGRQHERRAAQCCF
jgi:hypothetical protein